MDSPSAGVRVKVDGQGRIVLPLPLRRTIVSAPGEVLLLPTREGLLLTPVPVEGEVEQAPDGLPVLRIGRAVANGEVLAAIDRERGKR